MILPPLPLLPPHRTPPQSPADQVIAPSSDAISSARRDPCSALSPRQQPLLPSPSSSSEPSSTHPVAQPICDAVSPAGFASRTQSLRSLLLVGDLLHLTAYALCCPRCSLSSSPLQTATPMPSSSISAVDATCPAPLPLAVASIVQPCRHRNHQQITPASTPESCHHGGSLRRPLSLINPLCCEEETKKRS